MSSVRFIRNRAPEIRAVKPPRKTSPHRAQSREMWPTARDAADPLGKGKQHVFAFKIKLRCTSPPYHFSIGGNFTIANFVCNCFDRSQHFCINRLEIVRNLAHQTEVTQIIVVL